MGGGCPAVVAQWQNTGGCSQWCHWFYLHMHVLSYQCRVEDNYIPVIFEKLPKKQGNAASGLASVTAILVYSVAISSLSSKSEFTIGKKKSSVKMFAVGACLQTLSIYSSLK